MATEQDQAQVLADKFKKQGDFDRIKQDILSLSAESEDQTVGIRELIKSKVADIVKEMVENDPELIFKSRGSTSALLEAQLFKDGYKKLGDGDSGVQVNKFFNESVNSPELENDMKSKLEELAEDIEID